MEKPCVQLLAEAQGWEESRGGDITSQSSGLNLLSAS